jgi:predicted nucleotidyltransferase
VDRGVMSMSGLTAKTQEELKNIFAELISRVQPVFGDKLKKVILFGSYARGDYDAESDIDVMLILDQDDESLRKYNDILTEIDVDIDLKYGVVICSIMQNEQRFLKYQHALPFYTNVINEGVTLYEQ